MNRPLQEKIDVLKDFSACDISDALLKLQKPTPGKAAKGGFLADIVPYAPSSPIWPDFVNQKKVIGPASTLKLVDKAEGPSPLSPGEGNGIPKGSHWVDETETGTVLLIDQPPYHTCAAIGGIMATRMVKRDVAACVVSGRVRDLAELKNSGLQIWACGQSTVGTGAEAKVFAKNIPVTINQVEVTPGDIIFCDPLEGVVSIPADLIDQVLDLMPRLVEADDRVKADVEKGIPVAEAFKKHRS